MGLKATTRVGLVGDYDATVPAHLAIPIALRLAGDAAGVSVEFDWVPTEEIVDTSRVRGFSALWCVPASPYRSMAGALTAIRFARENRRPFLGTCGGFQHAIIEYARNVLGWTDAEHAETAPDATRPVITPLACALVEATDYIHFRPGSRIASIMDVSSQPNAIDVVMVLNPEFQEALRLRPVTRRSTRCRWRGPRRGARRSSLLPCNAVSAGARRPSGAVPPLVAAFVRSSAANQQVAERTT